MKLRINGREYDGAAQPFIGDLRLMKPEFGFGYGTAIRRLQTLGEDTDFLELLDDEDLQEALIAWMWMTRLRQERDLTVAEVRQTPLDAIEWVPEPGDELPEDGSVPTSARTDTGPGDSPAAATSDAGKTPKPASTKPSKKRSTAA